MDFESFEEIYKIDEDKSVNGVEVDFGFNAKDEPMILIIAEMGNAKNQKVMRKYDKALESSRHKKGKRQRIWAKIIAESILINWSGILDSKGKQVKPTMENKIAALIKYDRLFLDVMEASQDTERFRPDDEDETGIDSEEDTKENLPDTSDGTSNTDAS
jgi:hypothetical protein